MDVENQIITIRVNNFNEEHFKKLGYNFNLNDYIKIPAKHLPSGSGTKVDVECSYCKKIFKRRGEDTLKQRTNLVVKNVNSLK